MVKFFAFTYKILDGPFYHQRLSSQYLSVYLSHFFSKIAIRNSLKFYMGRPRNKATVIHQHRVCHINELLIGYVQNYAEIAKLCVKPKFALFFTYLWLHIHGFTSSRVCKVLGVILIFLCVEF